MSDKQNQSVVPLLGKILTWNVTYCVIHVSTEYDHKFVKKKIIEEVQTNDIWAGRRKKGLMVVFFSLENFSWNIPE